METNRIDITWKGLFRPIHGLKTYCHNEIRIEREVVPIIFVPGIMGSRLIRASDKSKLWDPDSAMFMLNNYGWLKDSARRRKELLIGTEFSPEYAEVSNCDEVHNKKLNSRTDKLRSKRGWGGVMWGSYSDLLINLNDHQWSEPINHCFELPVHAFGYNWCASNDFSGKILAEEIDRIMEGYRRGPTEQVGGPYKRICQYAILVTHSMGGLVARSACMLHGAKDKVLGVVHGVQPATGSPAAYWRMKAGFERPHAGPTRTYWDWWRNPIKMARHRIGGTITAKILGTDGEEVTSLLGNMPGGLELLPTADYVDNCGKSAWLKYPGVKTEVRLPLKDPYEEVYLLQDHVYRMINRDWLNPQRADNTNPDDDEHVSPGAWEQYKLCLQKAKKFHTRLGTIFHPHSYQFYGTDLDSADKIMYKRIPFTCTSHSDNDYDHSFSNKGMYATYVDENDQILNGPEDAAYVVAMNVPDGLGDGTVPISSGNALTIKEENSKVVGKNDASWFEIGHQDIYSTSAAQNFVFNCITEILLKFIETSVAETFRS